MQLAALISGILLAIAAAGSLWRLARGPSLLDRVLAIDVLLAILAAALCVDMVLNRHMNHLALLVAISLLGFIGSVTVARFVRDRRPDEH